MRVFYFLLLASIVFFACKRKLDVVSPASNNNILQWQKVDSLGDDLQCAISADSEQIYFLGGKYFCRYNANNIRLEKRIVNDTFYYRPSPAFLSQNFYVVPTFTSTRLDAAELYIYPTTAFSNASSNILQSSFLGEVYHYPTTHFQAMALNNQDQLVVAYSTPLGNWNFTLFNIVQGDTIKLTFDKNISVPLNNTGYTGLYGFKIIKDKIYFSVSFGLWYIVNPDGSYTNSENDGEMDFFQLRDTIFQYQTTYAYVATATGTQLTSTTFFNYSVDDGKTWGLYKTLPSTLSSNNFIVNNTIVSVTGAEFMVYNFKANTIKDVYTSAGSVQIAFMQEFQGYVYMGCSGNIYRMKSSDFFNGSN